MEYANLFKSKITIHITPSGVPTDMHESVFPVSSFIMLLTFDGCYKAAPLGGFCGTVNGTKLKGGLIKKYEI